MSSIAVGSNNPVKVQSALRGFEQMFPGDTHTAEGFSIPSGVSDQPKSSAETLRGAISRAQRVREACPTAGYAVGIEGGVEQIDGTLFAFAWIVVIDSAGQFGRGRSGSFALPPRVQKLVESGLELGLANDEVFGQHNSKQAGGAVGSLTGGTIGRQQLYEHAMMLALVAFKCPELFPL